MSSLVFLYAIFLTFLEGKLGHPFLEGKSGQHVQNLLQVTQVLQQNMGSFFQVFAVPQFTNAIALREMPIIYIF
ncbi:hypothetical protein [Nostoc sp.]|uniref:hypothetical protein n=1 Tax=Nostoc sp. TaxID=1180 RepID=UPI002FF6715A